MIRALALALLAASPALAQQQACAPREAILQKLAERFGETLRSIGLRGNDGVVEIYSSEATGTWTILLTRPDGMSCLLAAGQMWEQNAEPIGPQGESL